MNRTRLPFAFHSKYAGESLAFFSLGAQRLRADYLGRYP
jgi:hypothetical protein